MRPLPLRWILSLALGCCAIGAVQAQRVALLVGNAAYATGRLQYPARDVAQMRAALLNIGFAPADIQVLLDADQRALRRAVQDFGRRAQGADVAFMYYSGHGAQALGQNWLVPVGAEITTEAGYELEAVSAQAVINQATQARARVSVVVFDACRDNPTAVTKAGTKGLARMDAGDRTLIAFATAPHDTAADNGLYASVLAAELQKPGLELLQVFRNTTAQVRRATQGRQVPRVSEVTLDEQVFLAGAAPSPAPAPAPPQQVAIAQPTAGNSGTGTSRPMLDKVTLSADGYFDSRRASLKPELLAKLDDLAAKTRTLSLEVVIAVGHADSQEGPEAEAQRLSITRADAIKSRLVDLGIEANRVYIEGKGARSPVADNRTAEGRAKNRRVEIEVIGTRARP